jgi:hypothetical protein
MQRSERQHFLLFQGYRGPEKTSVFAELHNSPVVSYFVCLFVSNKPIWDENANNASFIVSILSVIFFLNVCSVLLSMQTWQKQDVFTIISYRNVAKLYHHTMPRCINSAVKYPHSYHQGKKFVPRSNYERSPKNLRWRSNLMMGVLKSLVHPLPHSVH